MKRSMVLVLTAAVIGMFSVSALAAEGVQERREGDALSVEGCLVPGAVTVQKAAELEAPV
ncbi:MAG: hypothetical protein ACLFSA_12405 [Spirochaetaceae bacterium]